MSTNIVQLLKTEKAKLQKHLNAIDAAINALNGDGARPVTRRRHMSAEARAKISAAAKKRWAKFRSGKN